MIKDKQKALEKIKTLTKDYNISHNEIIDYLNNEQFLGNSNAKFNNKINFAQKFLSYISSIFIFVGICLYVFIIWNDLNSIAKIVITLGSGITAYIISLTSINHNNYKHMAVPLLLISAALEPLGLLVIIHEFLPNLNNSIWSVIIVSVIMFIQYLITFLKSNLNSALFLTLIFAVFLFTSISNFLYISSNTIGFTLGVSLLLISYSMDKTTYKNISLFGYFFGSIALFIASFDALSNTIFELVFLCLTIFMIFISINIKSKTLLFTSACSLIWFLGYYSDKYFTDSLSWPIILIIIGLIFFAISGFVFKIKKKYF
tara:strand:- start:15727 stop:16674 length:948 start_codon:yes stop_codon:yes gene_type:complete